MRAAPPESEGTGRELGRRAGPLAAEALDHVWALALPRCPDRRGGPPPPHPVQGLVRQNVGNSQAPPPMLSSRDQNMTVDLYGPQDPCSLRSRPARSALGEIRKDIQL